MLAHVLRSFCTQRAQTHSADSACERLCVPRACLSQALSSLPLSSPPFFFVLRAVFTATSRSERPHIGLSIQLIRRPLSGDNNRPRPLPPLPRYLYYFVKLHAQCMRQEGIFKATSCLFLPSTPRLREPLSALATCLSRPLSAGRLMAVISKQPPAKVACSSGKTMAP